MSDAKFEDASLSDRPLRLKAESEEDLAVISSLLQDSVGRNGDIAWMPKSRRLAILLNRFRWEDIADAERAGRSFERVRSAVTVESVLSVRARGINPAEKGKVFELLALLFEPAEGGTGTLTLSLAGGGAVALDIECIDLKLADLTRPWEAVSGKAPRHDPGD